MFFQKAYYHNTLLYWILALATAMLIFFTARGVLAIFRKKSMPVVTGPPELWKALLLQLLGKIHPIFLMLFSIYWGSLWLTLPNAAVSVLEKGIAFILLLQCALLASQGIRFWTRNYRLRKIETDAGAVTTLSSVGFVLRILVWVMVLLIALDNLGVNVNALVASLGIGGIAVALAAQNILGDLFASFSIVFDKPFVIGDFIVVDTFMGTVEHVGLKTTRIRSLSGELLIFSNTDLLKSRIRNFKQMQERRAVFTIGVTYETPPEKLKVIPEMLRGIVMAHESVRFDRAHFKAYGPFSLDFEVVYWIHSPDYTFYMDIQQAINLDIFRRFGQEGIAFAYPTQTVVLKREAPASPLNPFSAEPKE